MADEYTPTAEDAIYEIETSATSDRSYMTPEGFKAALAEVKANIWDECMKEVRSEIRGIPSCGVGDGSSGVVMFDLFTDENGMASDSGARVVVFEVLDGIKNPYRNNESKTQ